MASLAMTGAAVTGAAMTCALRRVGIIVTKSATGAPLSFALRTADRMPHVAVISRAWPAASLTFVADPAGGVASPAHVDDEEVSGCSRLPL